MPAAKRQRPVAAPVKGDSARLQLSKNIAALVSTEEKFSEAVHALSAFNEETLREFDMQLDAKKIYWGSSSSFEKPGEIDYERIIQATPEYSEIKAKRIQRGTGKYWILLSQASDRVVRSISQVGQKTEYDLIAARGYLSSLDSPIHAEDVTKLLLENLQGKAKRR